MSQPLKTPPNVLVIGDVCEDVNVVCRVERICPEAPVPIHVPLSTTRNLGMAANTCNNLVALGAHTIYLFPSHTIQKVRHFDESSGYILVRIDIGDEVPPSSHFSRKDFEYLIVKEKINGVVLSDYAKGYLDESDIAYIAESSKARGIPVFLDTKRMLGDWCRKVTFVKINEKEYQKLKAKHDRPEDLCENMIVTLGGRGSWWAERNVEAPTIQVDVADVTGCGDVYLAAFALKHLETGGDVPASMRFANVAASITATKRGVATVTREEVERVMTERESDLKIS
jgi:D-beta-D-heptose 7-phosphate kinase/D-beta-D-heptose 1-phosphate adenosyltransferase